MRFLSISQNQMNSGKRCDSFGIALSITSGYQNTRGRIFPMDAANGLTYLLIGAVRDGAGIDYDDISSMEGLAFCHGQT